MKRALLAGFAVLLALAFVTCDVNTPLGITPDGNGDKPEVVTLDNGKQGVTLSIKVADTAGRSMTDAHARKWTNYYEVAFMDGDEIIYRTRWHGSETGRITVPFGNYAGVDPVSGLDPNDTPQKGVAIMFAGRVESDYSLLAVGELTGINSGAGTIIDDTTTSVTFTLTPLLADVKPDKTSSFKILTGPTGKETITFSAGGWNDADATATADGTTTVVVSPDNREFSALQTIRLNDTDIVKIVTVPPGAWAGAVASGVVTTGSGSSTDTFEISNITDLAEGDKIRIGATPLISGSEAIIDTITPGAGTTGTVTLTSAVPVNTSDRIVVWEYATTIIVDTATSESGDIEIQTAGTFPKLKYVVNGKTESIPMFYVAPAATAASSPLVNTASFTITDGATSPNFPHTAGVFVTKTTLSSTTFLDTDHPDWSTFTLADTSAVGITAVAGVAHIATNGTIPLTLDVAYGERGLSWLGIDIAVRAMSPEADLIGALWHIRSGLISRDPDLGSENLDDTGLPGGGKILLGTPDVKVSGSFEIIGAYTPIP